MVEWLMAHKVIVLVGVAVGIGAYVMFHNKGPNASGSSGGLGGVTPNSTSADPTSSQLTGLQEQLSNMMAGIAAKFGGGPVNSSGTPAPPGNVTPAGGGGVLTTTSTSPISAPTLNISRSVVTPLPVSGDAWQPPVAIAAITPSNATVAVASGAYLGASLGEKQYVNSAPAVPMSGPAIITALRQTGAAMGLLQAPKPAPAPVARPKPVPVYHPTAQQTASAYGGVSLGEGQYIKQAPAASPPPVDTVTHGKLIYQ